VTLRDLYGAYRHLSDGLKSNRSQKAVIALSPLDDISLRIVTLAERVPWQGLGRTGEG
jgi:hypothetical protein